MTQSLRHQNFTTRCRKVTGKPCDTMSQSWKGEFMDFFTEAVNVLADLVRALSCPDFPEEWPEMFPVEVREAAVLPVRIRRLWPPIRAEPGSGRQGQGIMKQQK
ncbi:Uncharacterised protein [uncultured Roseburia sp.]|nr:Uncharacterised protein [uncultured Roseburia sp.]